MQELEAGLEEEAPGWNPIRIGSMDYHVELPERVREAFFEQRNKYVMDDISDVLDNYINLAITERVPQEFREWRRNNWEEWEFVKDKQTEDWSEDEESTYRLLHGNVPEYEVNPNYGVLEGVFVHSEVRHIVMDHFQLTFVDICDGKEQIPAFLPTRHSPAREGDFTHRAQVHGLGEASPGERWDVTFRVRPQSSRLDFQGESEMSSLEKCLIIEDIHEHHPDIYMETGNPEDIYT